jgi:hypothetical protein
MERATGLRSSYARVQRITRVSQAARQPMRLTDNTFLGSGMEMYAGTRALPCGFPVCFEKRVLKVDSMVGALVTVCDRLMETGKSTTTTDLTNSCILIMPCSFTFFIFDKVVRTDNNDVKSEIGRRIGKSNVALPLTPLTFTTLSLYFSPTSTHNYPLDASSTIRRRVQGRVQRLRSSESHPPFLRVAFLRPPK